MADFAGMAPFPGGVVVKDREGAVIGSVGCSGAASDEDEFLAIMGIRASSLVDVTTDPADHQLTSAS